MLAGILTKCLECDGGRRSLSESGGARRPATPSVSAKASQGFTNSLEPNSVVPLKSGYSDLEGPNLPAPAVCVLPLADDCLLCGWVHQPGIAIDQLIHRVPVDGRPGSLIRSSAHRALNLRQLAIHARGGGEVRRQFAMA